MFPPWSPHLTLSELWFAFTHSILGGAGGSGLVRRRAAAPKGPPPTALKARTRTE